MNFFFKKLLLFPKDQIELLAIDTQFPGLEGGLFVYVLIWLDDFLPSESGSILLRLRLWDRLKDRDQQNSQGSPGISTFSPGYDPTMTCVLSSGADSAFRIPLCHPLQNISSASYSLHCLGLLNYLLNLVYCISDGWHRSLLKSYRI